MRELRSIEFSHAAVAASKSILSSATPGTSGGREGSLSEAASRSQSSICLEPAATDRGHHLRRADQADERPARELGGRAIVEPPAMPLERLALGLLADLRPVHFGARALLLRQLETFGADRIHEGEVVADPEIFEILRLLLPPASQRERPDHAGDPLAELDQGLPRPLQFRPDAPR